MMISRRKALQIAGAAAVGAAGAQAVGAGTAEAAGPTRLGTVYIPRIWGRKWIYRRNPTTRRLERVRVNNTKALYKGTSNAALNRGIGLWPDSEMPGGSGHVLLFGHRTSAGGPMRNAHLLKAEVKDLLSPSVVRPADSVFIDSHEYIIEKIHVVPAKPVHNVLIYPPDLPGASGGHLTIATCSTKYGRPTSLQYRLVIRARLKPPPPPV